ncbi:enoyl-CoA hydratase/isomerase family protein [Hydrocarboniphaga effusa]|jgi:enoyl-CoA hydratase|uniref:enoyl-CoA hydratase/isomerase family protein n=1 Tax=Hydrocarboniphaga effusa TaxID=243629 RepID=UPI003137C746
MYDHYKSLKIERRAHVLVVTLDNPPTNAADLGTHRELSTIFEDIARDEQTRVVVVTGAGTRAFSAGGDIDVMIQQIAEPEGRRVQMAEGIRMLHALLALEKPLIARINGHAIGFGATLAVFSDISYAVETAKLADPHVGVGLTAGDGGALIWPLLIGYARAKELLLTGDALSAKEAAAIGLITRAYPSIEALDQAVYAMADRLASGATRAINSTKTAINLVLRKQIESLIESHIGFEFMSAFSADHREAAMAFKDKRKPQFTGR